MTADTTPNLTAQDRRQQALSDARQHEANVATELQRLRDEKARLQQERSAVTAELNRRILETSAIIRELVTELEDAGSLVRHLSPKAPRTRKANIIPEQDQTSFGAAAEALLEEQNDGS